MTSNEKKVIRLALAKSVYDAKQALNSAIMAAELFGLDCRNIQNICYADGRDRVHSVLINGERT
jgi:protein-disulfide isomerase-like protein with CxxC motif